MVSPAVKRLAIVIGRRDGDVPRSLRSKTMHYETEQKQESMNYTMSHDEHPDQQDAEGHECLHHCCDVLGVLVRKLEMAPACNMPHLR